MALSTSWRALRPDLLAVVAVVNWGLSYGLTKLALAQWRPLAFTATRFLAMALIAATVLAVQRRLATLAGPDRGRFLLGGLLGFTIYQLGFVLGLDRTSAPLLDLAAGHHSSLLAVLPPARRHRARTQSPVGGRRPGHRRDRDPGPGQARRPPPCRRAARRRAQPRGGRQLCSLRHRDAAARRSASRFHRAGGLAPDRQSALDPRGARGVSRRSVGMRSRHRAGPSGSTRSSSPCT